MISEPSGSDPVGPQEISDDALEIVSGGTIRNLPTEPNHAAPPTSVNVTITITEHVT